MTTRADVIRSFLDEGVKDQIVVELLQALTPDQREEVGAIVVDAVRHHLKDNYHVRNLIEQGVAVAVRPTIERACADYVAARHQEFMDRIAGAWDTLVPRIVSDIMRRSLDSVRDKIVDGIVKVTTP